MTHVPARFHAVSQKNKVVPLNTIKAYESAYVFCHSFLTSALHVGEWSTSCPGQHPPPRDRIPLLMCIGPCTILITEE